MTNQSSSTFFDLDMIVNASKVNNVERSFMCQIRGKGAQADYKACTIKAEKQAGSAEQNSSRFGERSTGEKGEVTMYSIT